MTNKEREQFNKMRIALLRIANDYQTPAQLRRGSERNYGLEYAEALEYAYENIQRDARNAVKGIRQSKEPIMTAPGGSHE